jgi:hypothetical protein
MTKRRFILGVCLTLVAVSASACSSAPREGTVEPYSEHPQTSTTQETQTMGSNPGPSSGNSTNPSTSADPFQGPSSGSNPGTESSEPPPSTPAAQPKPTQLNPADQPIENNAVVLQGSGSWASLHPRTYRVTNSSEQDLTIDSVEVINTAGSAFSVGSSNPTCQGAVLRTLAANHCVVTVLFNPSEPGEYEGLLRLHLRAQNTVRTEILKRKWDGPFIFSQSPTPSLLQTATPSATSSPIFRVPRGPAPTQTAAPLR